MGASFFVVHIVVDKTGVPVTSKIWLISPNAASMSGMRQIGWWLWVGAYFYFLVYSQKFVGGNGPNFIFDCGYSSG